MILYVLRQAREPPVDIRITLDVALELISINLLASFFLVDSSAADPTDAIEFRDDCCLNSCSSEVSDAVLAILYCSVYVVRKAD